MAKAKILIDFESYASRDEFEKNFKWITGNEKKSFEFKKQLYEV